MNNYTNNFLYNNQNNDLINHSINTRDSFLNLLRGMDNIQINQLNQINKS